MIKRKTIETTREYDADGKLTRETITETVEDDNNTYFPSYPYAYPVSPVPSTTPVSPEITYNTMSNTSETSQIDH